MVERRLIEVEGLVQGVGFRPFVHELATRLALRGSVRNDSTGVTIDVEGEHSALDAFLRELTTAPPPQARIERVRLEPADAAAHPDFRIESSDERRATAYARVAPDIATCDDCLRELFEVSDRRYRYPFLSCSHCGPRLTISRGAPYDRDRTTMNAFPMCDRCRAEYDDPRDRRFHAQTIACAACGPDVALYEPEADEDDRLTGESALRRAADGLTAGLIVAVKGLGGFHLACDATSSDAVRRLRERKRREAKPLAVMVPDLAGARQLCEVSDEEATLLASSYRPIVLLRKCMASGVADEVAPGNQRLGVMLPYTPLHHLLLADAGRPLVMTSGNGSDEPIAFRNDDALIRLGDIADLMLLHDRDIVTRCDDSVVRVVNGSTSFLRRSRGYAPSPIALAHASWAPTLGVGGQLKNTFCLTRDGSALVSHHIGDLQNLDAYRALEDGIAHYSQMADVRPEVIAHDLHPDYFSTQFAERLSAEKRLERIAVQHHHAHVLSCVAEHGVTEPVIGVAFDGTGLGSDGAIWGGEFLLVDGLRYERLAHLSYVPLPGGDASVRHPWRAAVAHLWAAYGGDFTRAPRAFLNRLEPRQLAVVTQTITRPALAPPTSSVGRLFDAVAALLGVRMSAQFEAQAAMELESLADLACSEGYGVEIVETSEGWTIDTGSFIRGVVDRLEAQQTVAQVAGAFHVALARAAVDVVRRIAARTSIRRVALSGGVFQNARLTDDLTRGLVRAGFNVLVHQRVPCNDGGLSLGQAYAAVLHTSPREVRCA